MRVNPINYLKEKIKQDITGLEDMVEKKAIEKKIEKMKKRQLKISHRIKKADYMRKIIWRVYKFLLIDLKTVLLKGKLLFLNKKEIKLTTNNDESSYVYIPVLSKKKEVLFLTKFINNLILTGSGVKIFTKHIKEDVGLLLTNPVIKK